MAPVQRRRVPDRLRPQRRGEGRRRALHDQLAALGIDVLLDDRGERPGAMFADWELIGVPLRVVMSDRGLKAGTVEVQGRRDARPRAVPVAEALAAVKARLEA
jgi:prolyl-tRNA synthetase